MSDHVAPLIFSSDIEKDHPAKKKQCRFGMLTVVHAEPIFHTHSAKVVPVVHIAFRVPTAKSKSVIRTPEDRE
jgi:hypothetical protein